MMYICIVYYIGYIMITNCIHLLSVFMQTQYAYDEYCAIVRSAHSDEFWRFF